ncbi:MAG: crossover junction endodeoxyribonuclease RuvC [Oscillospiraceae bacterium]|nr:crossover junction endodeoxyribonuclease RuvC [Oscillospiraceae bacterium]
MRILGIDPGFAIVGYGVLDYENTRFGVISSGVITTPQICLENRLKLIFDKLNEMILQFSPDHVAIEKLFFTNNQKTAIDVAQARGVIMLAAVQGALELFEYTPLQIKQAVVGFGRAEKKQVIAMISNLLKLHSKIDDEADALAVAVCHAHSFRKGVSNSNGSWI